jgi:uncharacterized membrane-anchored protein
MNQDHTLVNAAQADGILPARAREIANDPSPSWVITTLSFIGAQFTVWPFLLLIALLGGKSFYEPPQSFVLAAVLIVGAVLGLRARLPIFVSHLCFSALLTGMGLLVFSLFFAMKVGNLALVILLLVQIGVALMVRVPWVQRLLGLGAAVTAMLIVPSLYGADGSSDERSLRMMYLAFPPIINTLVIALVWAAWCALEIRLSVHTLARNTGAFMDGVGVALLAAQVFASGAFFTSGGGFNSGSRAGSADSPLAGTAALFALNWVVVLQVLITVGAWWWLTLRWQLHAAGKRREWALLSVVYLCLAVFSFFTRDGGVVAIVGTVALATGRTRVLALAVFVLLAQLSGFYYALAWPLVHKAGLLVVVGAFLAVFLWALRRQFRPPTAPTPTATQAARPALALSLVAIGGMLSLGAANYDVMKKEQVITGGQKIYIALAPRDPRSLMQGDFMALNFGFPREIQEALDKDDVRHQSVSVVAALDSQGVATVLRVIDPFTPDTSTLPSGQIRLPLKRKGGQWVLVTDAFFFPEGRGEPFKLAKFGEFRALADGRALLIGLADDSLRPIAPSKDKTPANAGEMGRVEERQAEERQVEEERAQEPPARPASN